MTLARRIIRHLEGLTVSQGYGFGDPFPVWHWQRRFVHGAFRPGVKEALLSVGRGAGKTTLIAGIATAFLEADGVSQPNAEILIVASSLEQGGIAFRHMQRFVDESRNPYRVRDTKQEMSIMHRESGVRVRVLPAVPKALHGAAPSLIIADELAQWQGTRIDRMLAALRSSGGKVPGSRLILFGTRADTELHAFEQAIHEVDYAQVHAARLNDPPFQKRTWIRANPSVRYNPVLLDAYRDGARKAKRSPQSMQAFRALRLNQGVPDTVETYLIDPDVWKEAEGDAPAKGRCFWGIDLGSSAAASAVAAYYPASGRLEAVTAFGGVPDLRKRAIADGAGELYSVAERRGEIVLLGGRVPPVWMLLKVALRRFGRPVGIAADRWREAELRDALAEAGLYVPLDLRGQGFKDGAHDCRSFRNAIEGGKVSPVRSVFLTACMSEARTVSDPAGNRKLAKAGEGKRRQARDDAAAAAILAVSLGVRRGSAAPRKLYHGRVGG